MTDFTDLIDLASERLGGAVLAANDEFFAPKESLIKPTKPEWREGLYTERGKWMDGWETRRRRAPGEDWAVIRLGTPGTVRGVVIDTSFFTGNYPESASLDGCEVDGTPATSVLTDGGVVWQPLLPLVTLAGDTRNRFAVERSPRRVTHLRLMIHPDGGVARLRVHGEVVPPDDAFAPGERYDLAAMEHGGFVVECSDMWYGHRQNLILPGRSTHMGDGWETKRRRGPGHEWTIVRLAQRGVIDRVELDTDHFKGNAPGSCSLECADTGLMSTDERFDSAQQWRELVATTPLQPHSRHRFVVEGMPQTCTHVRLNIYPDGGVARLRLFGRPVEHVTAEPRR
jgi:allantoicase